METTRAIEIIRALADGRDPVTDMKLPPESPYQQADTVRALCLALEALDRPGLSRRSQDLSRRNPAEAEGRRPIDPNRPKAGGRWSPEEDQQLRDAFAARQPIRDMAQAHGRTTGAINSRLVKLGLIEPDPRHRPGQGNRPPSPIPQILPERPTMPPELTEEEKKRLPF